MGYILEAGGVSKSAQVRARIEPRVKEEAEAILEGLGITASTAISMFYKQIIHQHAIPFPVALPNEETRRAIEDARERRTLIESDSIEELLTAMHDED